MWTIDIIFVNDLRLDFPHDPMWSAWMTALSLLVWTGCMHVLAMALCVEQSRKGAV